MSGLPGTDPAVTVARAASEAGEVALRRRGDVTELIVGGVFVMDTVDVSTEVELATVALSRHPEPRRVLVGGLGLGFTAEAVLDDPRVEEVTVVEVARPLVEWAEAGLLPTDLHDPRLRLEVADVSVALAGSERTWDVVLLDVDNGPGFLVHPGNAGLYSKRGVQRAYDVLAGGGVLAIWSSHRASDLAVIMGEVSRCQGGEVEEAVRVVEREGRRLEYAIYLLTRAPEPVAAPGPTDLVPSPPRE